LRPLGINLLKCAISVQLILAIIIVRGDNRNADQDEVKTNPGTRKTQRQTIDTQHQKLKTHETHGPRTHGYLIVFTN
jgi:hypothetical protein